MNIKGVRCTVCNSRRMDVRNVRLVRNDVIYYFGCNTCTNEVTIRLDYEVED